MCMHVGICFVSHKHVVLMEIKENLILLLFSLIFLCVTFLMSFLLFRSISAEKRVAITLWILATGCDYRSVSHLFGVSRTSCCRIFGETVTAISKHLRPKYIQMPKGERLQEIIEGVC